MPIYEYYCPSNHTIYQFFAKTLAQGLQVPPCPDNATLPMQKALSTFAINRGVSEPTASGEADDRDGKGDPATDARMAAAMDAMEGEFSQVDENDPRAMARMMRKMADLTGEKIDGEMEEVVRKLEEGADPDSLEEQMGGGSDAEDEGGSPYGGDPSGAGSSSEPKEKKHRFRARRAEPRRDPTLYDYPPL